MKDFSLPFVKLPAEFLKLLKLNIPASVEGANQIYNVIKSNQALMTNLEASFKDGGESKPLQVMLLSIGWSNLRDRIASIYIYKHIYGEYPSSVYLDLIEDIKGIEKKYSPYSVSGYSRLFMLGLYMRFANSLNVSEFEKEFIEVLIPESIEGYLKLSPGRSIKIDWLILVLILLENYLGHEVLLLQLKTKKTINEIFNSLSTEDQLSMHNNLLAYSASICEEDFFLFDKV
jgi:hypothetical protein